MATASDRTDGCSAWNPGIETGIPAEYRALETLFRPESVAGTLADVLELAQLTGLSHPELVRFRPERLVLHELIVRVTAEIVVAEGETEEVFGWNFRSIVDTIHARDVAPRMASLRQLHDELVERVRTRAGAILDDTLYAPANEPPPPPRPAWRRLLGQPPPVVRQEESTEAREQRVVTAFRTLAGTTGDAFDRALYRALNRVLGSMLTTRGRIGSDRRLLAEMVATLVGNTYGSRVLGERLEPLIDAAIAREGYTRIHTQEAPILISLKGASAAGKSSLRPMIKQLMRDRGIEPDGYTTISPDVWRRALLDYDGLGTAYKYAGALTSREVMVIDGKLDRYIRRRAIRDATVPHLLVDRFRFDSFSSEKVGRVLHDTYARYVDTMYMYFVITAPEETVERGWQRGLERGRYKAVEDFLGHSVEAYAGMPSLLFKWLSYETPRFRFFFLDNMVPRGTFPRTIAEGDRNGMLIFRPLGLVDIERYRKIDIHARTPAAVYPSPEALAVERNCGFLRECLRQIPRVNFVDENSGIAYLHSREGRMEILDRKVFEAVAADAEMARLFGVVATELETRAT